MIAQKMRQMYLKVKNIRFLNEIELENAKMKMSFFGRESEKYTISKIKSKYLPEKSFITYHPNTINWQGVEIRDNIYDLLKELIV